MWQIATQVAPLVVAHADRLDDDGGGVDEDDGQVPPECAGEDARGHEDAHGCEDVLDAH